MDVLSIHDQIEGETNHITVFENYVSDRNLTLNDPLTGGLPADTLHRIFRSSIGTDGALFDDILLSKSDCNATLSQAAG